MEIHLTLSRTPVLIGTAIMTFIMLLFFNLWLGAAGLTNGDLFNFEFAFSKENLKNLVDSWSFIAQDRMRWVNYLDFLLPLAYSTCMAGLITRLQLPPENPDESYVHDIYKEPEPDLEAVTPLQLLMFLVPFATAFCDWVENYCHIQWLRDYNGVEQYYVSLGSYFSLFKWLLILADIGIIGLLSHQAFIQGSNEKEKKGK